MIFRFVTFHQFMSFSIDVDRHWILDSFFRKVYAFQFQFLFLFMRVEHSTTCFIVQKAQCANGDPIRVYVCVRMHIIQQYGS